MVQANKVKIFLCVPDEKAIFRLLDSQRLLQPGETPDFHWYKDGAPYDPEERFKVLFRVKPTDSGTRTIY